MLLVVESELSWHYPRLNFCCLLCPDAVQVCTVCMLQTAGVLQLSSQQQQSCTYNQHDFTLSTMVAK